MGTNSELRMWLVTYSQLENPFILSRSLPLLIIYEKTQRKSVPRRRFWYVIKHLYKLIKLSSQFSPKTDLILNGRRFNILLHAYKLALMTSLSLKKRTLNRRSVFNKTYTDRGSVSTHIQTHPNGRVKQLRYAPCFFNTLLSIWICIMKHSRVWAITSCN